MMSKRKGFMGFQEVDIITHPLLEVTHPLDTLHNKGILLLEAIHLLVTHPVLTLLDLEVTLLLQVTVVILLQAILLLTTQDILAVDSEV